MADRFATRRKLTPGQARTFAAWRYEDARCLWRTGLAKHMNGAVYLAGLVLDCLLKARLLDKHPGLSSADPARLTGDDLRRWTLVYRLHDLDGLLRELPDLARELAGARGKGGRAVDTMLRTVCIRWSVHLRYWPRRLNAAEATEFLEQVGEIKRWL